MSTDEILQKIYLFHEFTRDEIHLIAGIVKEKNLHENETLFNEGNDAESMFVVQYGTLKISRALESGSEVSITNISAGEHLGELPYIDGQKRSANVEATEKTQLLEIFYTDLKKVLESHPAIELKFYKAICNYFVTRMRTLTSDLTFARELKKRYS